MGIAAEVGLGPAPQLPASDRWFDAAGYSALAVENGSGTVYYVDGASGDDGHAGTSMGTAWKTISHALGASAVDDDATVRIAAGVYREKIVTSKAGSTGHRIVVGPHGDGPVIIDGSNATGTWALVSGKSYYRATCAFTVTGVVVDETPIFPEFSEAALTEGKWFQGGGYLYIWTPGGGSPASHHVGAITDQTGLDETTLYIDGGSNIDFYGLTICFAGGHGVIVRGSNVRFEQCRLNWNGKCGITTWASGVTPSGIEVIKNEVYHNVLINWPRGRWKWGGWPPSVKIEESPAALVQGNIVHKNGGEGILVYLPDSDGTIFRDNIVSDSWSVNIYVDNVPNVLVEKNLSYCNPPDSGDLYNNEDPSPEDGQAEKLLHAAGIQTADEVYGGLSPAANLENTTIQNNLVVATRRGIGHNQTASGSALKAMKVLNNTFVLVTERNISIPYCGGANTGSVYRNNLVYSVGASPDVLFQDDTPASGDKFVGLTIDRNVFYQSGKAQPYRWSTSGATYDHAGWLALSGASHGTGDVTSNPNLVDPADSDNAQAMRPQAGSPALAAGVDVDVDDDYDSEARSASTPSCGAFEGVN